MALTGSAAGRRHMGRVAALCCIACSLLCLGDDTPAQVHHIREGRIARNDFLTLPLCHQHHTGSRRSVHHDKATLLLALGVESEFDLLAIVLSRIEEGRSR